jgi:hypothetical protein
MAAGQMRSGLPGPVALSMAHRRLDEMAFPYVEVEIHQPARRLWRADAALVTVRGLAQGGYVAVLASIIGNPDDREFWLGLMHDLRRRGLRGVRVIAASPRRGVEAAISTMFATARWKPLREPWAPGAAVEIDPGADGG